MTKLSKLTALHQMKMLSSVSYLENLFAQPTPKAAFPSQNEILFILFLFVNLDFFSVKIKQKSVSIEKIIRVVNLCSITIPEH